MTLRDEIDIEVIQLWGELDDIPVLATYRQLISTDYDPATGTTPAYTDHMITVVEDVVTEAELQQAVAGRFDKAFLIRSTDVNKQPIKVNGLVVVNEVTWRIASVSIDPAGAVWRAFCHA